MHRALSDAAVVILLTGCSTHVLLTTTARQATLDERTRKTHQVITTSSPAFWCLSQEHGAVCCLSSMSPTLRTMSRVNQGQGGWT